MAQAIPKSKWLESEETAMRATYVRYLVERWLWRAPFTVLHDALQEQGGVEVPSPRALEDNCWVLEPESTVSH